MNWMPATVPRIRAEPCAPSEPPPRPLRAITLWTPWPWLIAAGYKPIENRKRKPPLGSSPKWLVIHAGQKEDTGVADQLGGELGIVVQAMPSAIVGLMLIDGYVTESDSPWFIGPFGWTVRRAVLLAHPIRPIRGSQGFFFPGDAVDRQILGQWNDAEHREWTHA